MVAAGTYHHEPPGAAGSMQEKRPPQTAGNRAGAGPGNQTRDAQPAATAAAADAQVPEPDPPNGDARETPGGHDGDAMKETKTPLAAVTAETNA